MKTEQSMLVVSLASGSLTEFFFERLNQAQRDCHITLVADVQCYIIHLLCSHVRVIDEDPALHDCLALTLQKALESPYGEKVNLYKKLADRALYISGFFQGFFQNKTYGLGYYMSMGQRAYCELSSLVWGKPQSHLSDIYRALSEDFVPSVRVLAAVSSELSTTP